MTPANRTNAALVPFLKGLAEVETVLDELRDKASNHFDTNPDAISWADVGDVRRILHLITEANRKEK